MTEHFLGKRNHVVQVKAPLACRRRVRHAMPPARNVAVLSMNHLIVNKKAAGRLQDPADVEKLEAILASNTKER